MHAMTKLVNIIVYGCYTREEGYPWQIWDYVGFMSQLQVLEVMQDNLVYFGIKWDLYPVFSHVTRFHGQALAERCSTVSSAGSASLHAYWHLHVCGAGERLG